MMVENTLKPISYSRMAMAAPGSYPALRMSIAVNVDNGAVLHEDRSWFTKCHAKSTATLAKVRSMGERVICSVICHVRRHCVRAPGCYSQVFKHEAVTHIVGADENTQQGKESARQRCKQVNTGPGWQSPQTGRNSSWNSPGARG